MGVRTVLARLFCRGGADVVVECRQCGTTVEPGTDQCPECGATELSRYSIRLPGVKIAKLHLLLRDLDYVGSVSFFDRCGKQTAESIRYFHRIRLLHGIQRTDHLALLAIFVAV